MAKLTKSRSRKPLAEGVVSFGASRGGYDAANYSTTIDDRDEDDEVVASFRLDIGSKEALRFVDLIAGFETHEAFAKGYYSLDRRTTPEKLRALADQIEGEA